MSDSIKVSVVVPIYNMGEYLNECLDSLVNQTLKEIEVLMVNDGSTDSSEEIASEYANKYSNFYLFNKSNGGLSSARNYAIPFVKGEYIAFLDSDDYVSEDAYEKLYDMSGNGECDIIMGNVERFNSKRYHSSSLHVKVFKDDIKNTNIFNYPELIYDTIATNKLFKLEFWIANDFKFPEGVLYEDIPVIIPAQFKSESTAVLTDIIYFWREREGLNKSITQDRVNITNFKDRLNALKSVDRFVEENVVDETCIYYKYFKWIDLDLKIYINLLDQADNDFIEYFIPQFQNYIKNIPKYVFKDLRAIDQIKYYFIEISDVDSLLQTLDFEKNRMKSLEVVLKGDKYFGKFPFKGIPEEYFEMTNEFNTGSEVRQINKMEISDGVLNINGYLYIKKVNFDKKSEVNFKAKLVNIVNGKELELNIENIKIPELSRKFWVRTIYYILRSPLDLYHWSGYNINIDLNDPKLLELGQGTYKIVINLQKPGIDRDIILGSKNNKPIVKPYLANYNNLVVKYNAVDDLCFIVKLTHSGVINSHYKKEGLYLEGWFDDKTLENHLMICQNEDNTKIPIITKSNDGLKINSIIRNKFPDSEGFTAIIPNEIMKNLEDGNWFLKHYRAEQIEPLNGNVAQTEILDKNLISLFETSAGDMVIRNDEVETYLYSLNWENSNLKLSTCLNKDSLQNNEVLNSKLRFVSKADGITFHAESVDKEENEIFLKNHYEVKTIDEEGLNLFLQGIWEIYADYSLSSSVRSQKITVINHKNFENKNFSTHSYQPCTLDGYLGLKVDLVWSWESMTPNRRKILERYVYSLLRYLPINNKRILFDSYWTTKYSCNPRYLYEYIDKNYPEYECIWVFNDESMKINGNGKKVRFQTLKYFYYMATSKYFVSNVNFPDFYKKRKGAVEIQTMHGTPLKTIGLDVESDFKTKESRDKFIRRCKRWDYLIVSSDKVADISKRCFLFNKEFLKVGYPRIDEIFKLNTPENIRKIKADLKIPENKTLILYAPTWRVKDQFEMMLDLKKMKEILGDEYILLLRLHHFSINGLDRDLLNDFVIDISGYESIEKLYVISDALITDYSSVMFDYGVLNKPMIFFAYDLNKYKNYLRGFNLDFEKEAPGPIVSTSDEVIDEIIKLNTIKSRYVDKITAFELNYLQYENGTSCKNVFEKVIRK